MTTETTLRAQLSNRRGHEHAVLALALTAALTLPTGCAPAYADQQDLPTSHRAPVSTYPVGTPEIRDVFVEREFVCEIRAVRYAEVRSRVKGVLESLAVDDGQAVEAGALLFSVSARELQQELRVAQAAVGSAEAEVRAATLDCDNARRLLERNIVAQAELDLQEAQLAILEARLEEARAEAERAAVALDLAHVRAPFAGVVNRVLHKGGSAVHEDELLTTISDASEVHAYFALSEREMLAQLHAAPEGHPREVRLMLADGSTLPETGIVDATASEIDPDTGTLTLRARFANPGGILKHGSRAKAVFRESIPNALLVPQVATFDAQGSLFAYVVDESGVARARKLSVRCRISDAFVIDGGLEAGERFVLEGVHRIRDGQHVAARPSAS